MKIEQVATADLILYEKNPRKNDKAVGAVASSIERFGFRVPIVVGKNKVVVAGHTRLKAAQKLGLEAVPCIVAEDLTDEQLKAFRLIDNKTAELATWDMEKLIAELDTLSSDLSKDFYQLNPTPEKITLPDNSVNEKREYESMEFTFSAAEKTTVDLAIAAVLSEGVKETYGNPNRKSNALYEIVRQWGEQRKLS